MLVRLGEKRPPDDLLGLLGACHVRIRKFAAMACELAGVRREGGPPVAVADARDAAGAVRRYFAEALPLHVADEEELIVPRLRGRDPAVDAALAAMAREHGEHEAGVARLVELCAAIEGDPARLPALRAELADVAAALAAELESHLEVEERVIFPALRALPPAEQQAIRAGMRARREPG